jgi:anthranilate phosphoribosyltransferase
VVQALLAGQRGPIRDVVLLNAAAALVAVAPSSASLTEQLAAGMARCAEAVDTGAANATLSRWITVTQDMARAGE